MPIGERTAASRPNQSPWNGHIRPRRHGSNERHQPSRAPSTAGHRGETAMTFFWRTNTTTWRLRVGPVFPVPRRVAVTKT